MDNFCSWFPDVVITHDGCGTTATTTHISRTRAPIFWMSWSRLALDHPFYWNSFIRRRELHDFQVAMFLYNKKLIARWDSERELSLRRHRTRTTKYNSLVHKFRHRSTRRLRWNVRLPNSVKLRNVTAITPFKVIQGHRFWYQSKAHIRLPISD